MPNQQFNPLRSVDGGQIPCPSKYDVKYSDISASDAGRTEDCVMHKMTIGRKVHIELEWSNIPDEGVKIVLRAFTHREYFEVTYYDYMMETYETKTFYVGDRSVASHNRATPISTVTFNIIER